MTTEQKTRIASLRSAGQGYTVIARELGLSKSAILASFRRAESAE